MNNELISKALANAEALKLDPANSTTPHCIEEYNSGLTNAISAIRESLQVAENRQ